MPVFGYPITDEYTDAQTGFVTQYFERARFEWHPGDLAEHYDVLLGLLGVELAQRGLTGTTPFQRINAAQRRQLHLLPADWSPALLRLPRLLERHGGLAIFGFPISEEFHDPETGFTVQYFERQRFE